MVTRATGYNTSGDVLVNVTADGVDLNAIWAEIADALAVYNTERSAIAQLVSFPTTLAADAVPQSVNDESFDEASEFGVPTALREPATYLKLGYTFKDYDKSLRATWRFLRDATAEQVTAQVTRIFEADNRLVNGTLLNRLFTPTEQANEWSHRCFGVWTGDDGITPPPYLGTTFTSDHSHYLTTGSTTLDSADVEEALKHITEHGYGVDTVAQLLLFVNPLDAEASAITAWRAGIEYATGKTPLYDFIPSALLPAWLSNETIHGPTPPDNFHGLKVWGSYANALVIFSTYVPKGYVAVVATGGPNSDMNPVGMRQHVNTAYQGLRHIPGPVPAYPLQNSFFARGFGVGVRHRGAACVMQITTDSSYTAPVFAT